MPSPFVSPSGFIDREIRLLFFSPTPHDGFSPLIPHPFPFTAHTSSSPSSLFLADAASTDPTVAPFSPPSLRERLPGCTAARRQCHFPDGQKPSPSLTPFSHTQQRRFFFPLKKLLFSFGLSCQTVNKALPPPFPFSEGEFSHKSLYGSLEKVLLLLS